MLVMRAIICLVVFLGSAYGRGQQVVSIGQHISQQAVGMIGRPKTNSSVTHVDKQSEDAKDMAQIIYQAPMQFPDWPINDDTVLRTRISDDQEFALYPGEETSTAKPIEHLSDIFDTFKPKYDLVDGLGYYRIVKGMRLNWEEARSACRAEGAHLAVINSKREATALGRLFFEHGIKPDLVIHTAWIGAYRPQGQHRYITVHGTQLKAAGFNTWEDQTHLNTGERCVVLNASESKLSSTSCNRGEHHICEHPL